MLKKIFLLSATFLLLSCGSAVTKNSNDSYDIFTWKHDRTTNTIHAKIISLPSEKVLKEVTIDLSMFGDGVSLFDDSSDSVKYDASTDSIVFQMENYDEYLQENMNKNLDFHYALYRTDFQASRPVEILAERVQGGLIPWALSEKGTLLFAGIYHDQNNLKLTAYDLSSMSISKECDTSEYLNAISSSGNDITYFSYNPAGKDEVHVDPKTCNTTKKSFMFPPKDDYGFQTNIRPLSLSPDSRWLVFSYFLVNQENGSVEPIQGAPATATEGLNTHFSWSSDSQYLVFSSYESGNVYLYSLQKKETKKIPVQTNFGADFLPDSHKVYIHDYPNKEEKNTIFDIDTWTSEEHTIPQGQIIGL